MTDVIIFGIGNDWLARAACNAILIQGVGQYLVNLNIWTHNILTLLARSRVSHIAVALTLMPARGCMPASLICCIPALKMRGPEALHPTVSQHWPPDDFNLLQP